MNQKLNLFQQLIASIKGFNDTDDYYTLSEQSTGSKIGFAILFSALSWILTLIIIVVTISTDTSIEKGINELPDFVYYNRELTVADEVTYPLDDEAVFYINTNYPIFYCTAMHAPTPPEGSYNVDELINQYASEYPNISQYVFICQKNVVNVEKVGSTYQAETIYLGDLLDYINVSSFSKATAASGLKSILVKFMFIVGLIALIVVIPGVFVIALLYSILGSIINAILKTKEDYDVIYWMSLYATVALSILSAIVTPLFHSSILARALCIGLYIFLMIRVLKKGNTGVALYSPNAGISNHGVVNDDFDSFMRQDPFTEARNEAQKEATRETKQPYSEVNTTNDSYYGSAISPTQPVKNNNDPFAPSNTYNSPINNTPANDTPTNDTSSDNTSSGGLSI